MIISSDHSNLPVYFCKHMCTYIHIYLDIHFSLFIYSLCINYSYFFSIFFTGTGTFGRVCLCRDRVSEKYCAMKLLAMTDVIRLKQTEHVKNERNILREIRHPFVISL